MSDLMKQGLNDMIHQLALNDSQRARYHRARDWTPADFLSWYMKTSHASRNMTSDYLYGMEDAEVKALTRVTNDLVDDLARHRKRKLCIERLNEGEQLANW
jgi:hypothetical protein